ncbi:MAG: hypothetical protein JNK29_07070 [Anaerolineales bacterium]|nr:hypothetical protein [Anaerolineales bacterium]
MTTNLLAPELAGLDLAAFMREALTEAEQAALAGRFRPDLLNYVLKG